MPDPCFTDVNCTDIPAPGIGSFCDACPEGYSGSGLTGDCYDIDDCVGSPCGDEINNCTDTGAVSYACDCGEGYGYDENAGTCVVLLSMTVAANLDEITASPEALDAFKSEFSGGLASMLGVDATRVKVMGVSAGSVVVDFIIMTPPPVVSTALMNVTSNATTGAAVAAPVVVPSVAELVAQFTQAKESGSLGAIGSYQSLPDPEPEPEPEPLPPAPSPSRSLSQPRTVVEEEDEGSGWGTFFFILLCGGGVCLFLKTKRPDDWAKIVKKAGALRDAAFEKAGGVKHEKKDMTPKIGEGVEFRDSIDLEEQQETDNPLAAGGAPPVADAAAAQAAAEAAMAASAAMVEAHAAHAAMLAAHAASLQSAAGGSPAADRETDLVSGGGVALSSNVAFDVEESSRPAFRLGEAADGDRSPGAKSDDSMNSLDGQYAEEVNPMSASPDAGDAWEVEESSRPRGGTESNSGDGLDMDVEPIGAAEAGATFDVEDAIPDKKTKRNGKFGTKFGGKGKKMGGKMKGKAKAMTGAEDDDGIDASDALAMMRGDGGSGGGGGGMQLGKQSSEADAVALPHTRARTLHVAICCIELAA